MKDYFNILLIMIAIVPSVNKLFAQCSISQAAFYQSYSIGSCDGMSFQSTIGGPLAVFDDCGGRDYTSIFTTSSNPVGIGDQISFSFKIFPNPVIHTLQVDLPDLKTVMEFKILNATGRLIKSGQFYDFRNHLDLMEMENGYYFIKLSALGYKSSIKSFVKISP